MNIIRGYLRLWFIGLTIAVMGILIMLVSWLRLPLRRITLAAWLTTLTSRIIFRIADVHFHCPDAERIRRHEGFVFANHISYFDIFTLIYLLPMRFLAKEEVRRMPFVGQAGRAIGCVFVDRESKSSRAEARSKLAQVERYPPIALFPEGRRSAGDEMLPFRYGAFEIVIQGSIPLLPCVIVYDRPDVVLWHRGESIIRAVWRLASRPGPIHTHLIPLGLICPGPDDDSIALSVSVRERMMARYREAQG